MVWYAHLFQNFPQFIVIHTVKGFGIVNKAEIDVPIPKKGNAKECSNCCTITRISHASNVMLKILQARVQQYVNHKLLDAQVGFRKGRITREKLPTSVGSLRKQESSRKISTSVLLTMPKPLCGSQ